MRIVGARITPVRLALARPLATARGTLRAREGAVLSLLADSGARGWGEALPLPGFGQETASEAFRALERIAAGLVGDAQADLDTALDAVSRLAPHAKSARAAADAALHDLAAQEAGRDVATLLHPARRERVEVSALVGGDDPAAAAAAARRALRRGFRTLKLKLLTGDLARAEARVAAVREAVGGGAKLRLDANGAWKEATAFEAVERLARFDVELIEQPVAPADIAALARVRAASPIPIAADESVRDEDAAERLIASAAADVLVVKPAALGGLRTAGRIALRARRAGIDFVVTSFLDSSLGIAAALHLAGSLPESRFAAGLATAGLLSHDLAKPFPVAAGAIALPRAGADAGRIAAGLGVAPSGAALRRCATGATRELRA